MGMDMVRVEADIPIGDQSQGLNVIRLSADINLQDLQAQESKVQTANPYQDDVSFVRAQGVQSRQMQSQEGELRNGSAYSQNISHDGSVRGSQGYVRGQ